jgi:hypothetical protein
MSVPVIIDLPDGDTLETGDPSWPEIASAKWNRPRDDGYIEWTQSICRHSDGRLLAYVIMLPPSGILRTAGEILADDSLLVDTMAALAKKFDVPTNVPYSCIQRYKRVAGKK